MTCSEWVGSNVTVSCAVPSISFTLALSMDRLGRCSSSVIVPVVEMEVAWLANLAFDGPLRVSVNVSFPSQTASSQIGTEIGWELACSAGNSRLPVVAT